MELKFANFLSITPHQSQYLFNMPCVNNYSFQSFGVFLQTPGLVLHSLQNRSS